jgi:hypothetical protein
VYPPRLAEIIAGGAATLDALIRDFHFVSLFHASTESLGGGKRPPLRRLAGHREKHRRAAVQP